VRKQIEDDEDARLILQALRGQNLNDDDRAVAGLEMKLVDVKGPPRRPLKASSSSSSSAAPLVAPTDDDALPLEYNPGALQQFFKRRPGAVLTRIGQVASVGGGYLSRLFLDRLLNRSENDPDLEVTRAAELRDIITSLGPFYIKIGQALSIRPDVLSPRAMVELQKLCDKVPSFDSAIAFACIEEELGRPVSELFSDITPEPVAAASLGQVYRATLRATGDTVAVKVQRPNVLETVSLDLYLARQLGLFARNFPALSSRLDAVALLDEFAGRFYQELDYDVECENGFRIAEAMRKLPMVVIPRNYPAYTSRRVHTAEWIDGEKLSQSTADDVGALVNLGVITYLTQLLDAGFFHADPHPGNMMRTADGRLAILDFGLMTEITDDQKYGMIEAIIHLIQRDYSSIGQDFINLDFIPRGTDTAPIVPALTKVFDVALAGGGAKSINFQELASDLAQITFDYPFRIPPYFALVIRAISVLEGIALVGNPNFGTLVRAFCIRISHRLSSVRSSHNPAAASSRSAIIDEAYPYIARQLMTDRSPRLRSALRYMVYGKEGTFDAENLIDLLQALEKFTAVRDDGDGTAFKVDGVRGTKVVGAAGDFAGSQKVDVTDRDTDVDGGRFRVSAASGAPALAASSSSSATATTLTTSQAGGSTALTPANDERTVREALRFFFGKDGEVFREFILEEVVTVVDASGREGLRELARTLGFGRIVPVPSFVRALTPPLSENDRRMVRQIQTLVQFLLGDFDGSAASTSIRLRKLVPVVREFAPELRSFGTLLVARLTEKAFSRGLNWATARL
jgi:aarF domain-containing kinase